MHSQQQQFRFFSSAGAGARSGLKSMNSPKFRLLFGLPNFFFHLLFRFRTPLVYVANNIIVCRQ